MKRSARSIPTGKGSRGGGFAQTPEYYRAWRQAHPDYRERDNNRRRLRHAQRRAYNTTVHHRHTNHPLRPRHPILRQPGYGARYILAMINDR